MSTDTVTEYNESTTITLEWTLRGLKNLFESSKGDAKSKVTKSVRFGPDGRWQVLLYANSGSVGGATASESGGGYVSLYLSCEPTLAEKEAGVNGKWTREGLFNFRFEIRPLGKTFQFNSKEAHNRQFSSKTANLGWAQFALRDAVFYQAPASKTTDCFVVLCTITNVAGPPVPPPAVPRQAVPRDVIDRLGSLLDDPRFSDVEFILPTPGQPIQSAKRIYAASKLLRRVDYFDIMFSSGFRESETLSIGATAASEPSAAESMSSNLDDSDAEDEDDSMSTIEDDNELDFDDSHPGLASAGAAASLTTGSTPPRENEETEEPGSDAEGCRNVRPKLSHPSSPRTRTPMVAHERDRSTTSSARGPHKMQVVIKDASYWTYRAVLYYIYTDSILFAPLSSSFLTSVVQISSTPEAAVTLFPAQTPGEEKAMLNFTTRPTQQVDTAPGPGPKSRKEWIAEWEASNLGRPRPCSAKAVYRLADRLDLRDLKERAFQHIIKSLTAENVPYEVFSNFSATFEEVRKVQVEYFLDNWSEIRGSDAMQNIWQQIRNNRHPGFEQVWPLIAQNLEFRPRAVEDSGREAAASEV